ncbi:hypothetical protein HKD37_05G013231 [Glycine soja]
MQALMVLRRNHMFVIIKKGENVNVCIHDFDDVKRRIKQGSEESNKAHFASRLIQDCLNKQSLDSRFLQDQALPQNERFQVIQGTCNRLPMV